MTVEQVAALRSGDAVRVIWSGGNGPWDYIVSERAGTLYAGHPRNDNPLTGPGPFVGQERFHTRVWQIETPACADYHNDDDWMLTYDGYHVRKDPEASTVGEGDARVRCGLL